MRIDLLKPTFRVTLVGMISLAILGCVTSPIPPGYVGPTAAISDWSRSESNSRASVFDVAAVDGKPIRTSVDATQSSYAGRGISAYFNPTTISREVPAKTLSLKLEGRIMYSAPIQELLMAATLYRVDSTIEVTLLPGRKYIVRGDLFENQREIYLEDAETKERVGKVVR